MAIQFFDNFQIAKEVFQNVDDWQTAMNWGRPENNGFRSVWNAGLDISDNVEAYSFGNYADTYG